MFVGMFWLDSLAFDVSKSHVIVATASCSGVYRFLLAEKFVERWEGSSCWGFVWYDLRVVCSKTTNEAVLKIIETFIFLWNHVDFFKQKLGFITETIFYFP